MPYTVAPQLLPQLRAVGAHVVNNAVPQGNYAQAPFLAEPLPLTLANGYDSYRYLRNLNNLDHEFLNDTIDYHADNIIRGRQKFMQAYRVI